MVSKLDILIVNDGDSKYAKTDCTLADVVMHEEYTMHCLYSYGIL